MKKKFYAIGSLIAVIIPTMAIVSCTDSDCSGSEGLDPGSENANIVKSDKITLAKRYTKQKTVYVEYEEDATKRLDSAGNIDREIATAIAEFAESIPGSKMFDTLMVRIKGFFGGTYPQNKKVYTLEINEPNYPVLNGKTTSAYKNLLESAWASKKTFNEKDATPKKLNEFKSITTSDWSKNIKGEVDKVINAWNSKNLMAWRGGMSENLASGVTKLGSKSSLAALEDSDFTVTAKRLFLANEEVLGEDHQSTLLTILWYYKNAGGVNSGLTEAHAVGIHKAFVEAWNNSFTREQNDLDPATFLKGLAEVSPDLASFVTSNVPFVKEDL